MDSNIYLKYNWIVVGMLGSPDPICSLQPQEGIKGNHKRPKTTSELKALLLYTLLWNGLWTIHLSIKGGPPKKKKKLKRWIFLQSADPSSPVSVETPKKSVYYVF